VGAAFVFVCRRPVLGIGVNFDFLILLIFVSFLPVQAGRSKATVLAES